MIPVRVETEFEHKYQVHDVCHPPLPPEFRDLMAGLPEAVEADRRERESWAIGGVSLTAPTDVLRRAAQHLQLRVEVAYKIFAAIPAWLPPDETAADGELTTLFWRLDPAVVVEHRRSYCVRVESFAPREEVPLGKLQVALHEAATGQKQTVTRRDSGGRISGIVERIPLLMFDTIDLRERPVATAFGNANCGRPQFSSIYVPNQIAYGDNTALVRKIVVGPLPVLGAVSVRHLPPASVSHVDGPAGLFARYVLNKPLVVGQRFDLIVERRSGEWSDELTRVAVRGVEERDLF